MKVKTGFTTIQFKEKAKDIIYCPSCFVTNEEDNNIDYLEDLEWTRYATDKTGFLCRDIRFHPYYCNVCDSVFVTWEEKEYVNKSAIGAVIMDIFCFIAIIGCLTIGLVYGGALIVPAIIGGLLSFIMAIGAWIEQPEPLEGNDIEYYLDHAIDAEYYLNSINDEIDSRKAYPMLNKWSGSDEL